MRRISAAEALMLQARNGSRQPNTSICKQVQSAAVAAVPRGAVQDFAVAHCSAVTMPHTCVHLYWAAWTQHLPFLYQHAACEYCWVTVLPVWA